MIMNTVQLNKIGFVKALEDGMRMVLNPHIIVGVVLRKIHEKAGCKISV